MSSPLIRQAHTTLSFLEHARWSTGTPCWTQAGLPEQRAPLELRFLARLGDLSASISHGLQERFWKPFSSWSVGKNRTFRWDIWLARSQTGERGGGSTPSPSPHRGSPGFSQAGEQFPSVPLDKRQEQLPSTERQTNRHTDTHCLPRSTWISAC